MEAMKPIEILYHNFDALHLSFQCAVPEHVLRQLYTAKFEAQTRQSQVVIQLEPSGLQIAVHHKGSRGGGFVYQFHTGSFGAIWLLRDSQDKEGWNISVKPYALSLAVNGYENVRHEILDVLQNDLQAKGPHSGLPVERISRVDYCIDFLVDAPFEMNIHDFTCHNRTKKRRDGKMQKTNDEVHFSQVTVGGNTETITIGKMPGKQVCAYNKEKEISVSNKPYFFDIWGIKPELLKEKNKTIIRVEIRAGKKALNNFDIKRFSQLHKHLKSFFKSILNDIRYKHPLNKDLNHKMWDMALNAINDIAFNYHSNADKEKIAEDLHQLKLDRYKSSMQGYMIGLTALQGKPISEIPGVLHEFGDEMMDEFAKDPNKFIEKHNRKRNEFFSK